MSRRSHRAAHTRTPRVSAIACATAFAVMPALAQQQRSDGKPNPTAVIELPGVEVIATTPLPGVTQPLKDIGANVQRFSAKESRSFGAQTLADLLEKSGAGVNINPAQGNTYQPDLNFRGFAASPLLGTPQGISIFVDGVRVNEPFGDLVFWDLIPQQIISSANLIPGSNSIYGLNTLGGALTVFTKSGHAHAGTRAALSGGSWGRRVGEIESGGSMGDADYYVAADSIKEDGWRRYSDSRLKRFFGKVGYETELIDIDFSATFADNDLRGTQSLPRAWLDDAKQPYTWPDITQNKLNFFNLRLSRNVGSDHLTSADFYYRKLKTTNLSSNINDAFAPGAVDETNAINDRNVLDQRTSGATVQYSYLGSIAGRKNQFTIGVNADRSRATFTQDSQPAQFTPDRSAVGVGDFTRETFVRTRNRNLGVYFTNTHYLMPELNLTVSGRQNEAKVTIRDASGLEPALDGDHIFRRFTPGVALTFAPDKGIGAYASYNEGIRAPSPVELTCADPEAPCKLPNNFLADPPLKPVVSKTIEAGVRGAGDWRWNATVFRTELQDDIQFIIAGASNAGYFQNVGKTRRQGLELGASTRQGPWRLSASYAYVDATYQSNFPLFSPDNSTAEDNGEIDVRKGNRIPAIPRHIARASAGFDVSEALSIGLNVFGASSQFARGDENNADANGKIPGYAIVNAEAEYRFAPGWRLFADARNLFDRKRESFGVLGRNFFNGPGRAYDASLVAPEQFRSSVAPRGIWIGVEYRFGGK